MKIYFNKLCPTKLGTKPSVSGALSRNKVIKFLQQQGICPVPAYAGQTAKKSSKKLEN